MRLADRFHALPGCKRLDTVLPEFQSTGLHVSWWALARRAADTLAPATPRGRRGRSRVERHLLNTRFVLYR